MKHILPAVIAALATFQSTAFAAPLVGSTFEDSVLGAAGRTEVVTTNNSNLTPWYLGNSTTADRMEVIDDIGGFGKSASLLRTNFGLTNFSPVSLSNGQSLKISFDYHYTLAPSTGAEGLRILLFSSGAATLLSGDTNTSAAGESTTREDYSGYYFGIGATNATSTTSQTFVRQRSEGNDKNLNSTEGLSIVGTGSTSGVASGISIHQVEITLKRDLDDLVLSISVDNVVLIQRTDSTAQFDFNTLMISNSDGTTGNTIFLDNIQLEVIPEPAAASLLGGGILFLASRRFGVRANP